MHINLRKNKIHTTKLYLPSGGEANSAEILVEIPSGTGGISLSIHRAGSSNHILGPNGWQSADYWFNGTPSEVNNDNVAWFSLPAQLVEHITFSNYSVFCQRAGNLTKIRTILTGGALVAKPIQANPAKGDVELPPLPKGFSQAVLGSLAAVEKTPELVAQASVVVEEPALVLEDTEFHSPNVVSEQPAPEAVPDSAIASVQPEMGGPSAAEPVVPSRIVETVSTPPEDKLAPDTIGQKPGSNLNLPILLGALAVILLAILFYFFAFKESVTNNEGVNAPRPVQTKKPETPPAPPVQKAPEPAPPSKPEPAKPVAPPEPEKKISKPTAPESKPASKKTSSNSAAEPVTSTPAPEKPNPTSSPIPDLNRMVNEALKR